MLTKTLRISHKSVNHPDQRGVLQLYGEQLRMQELVLAHPGGTSHGELSDNACDVPCDRFRAADRSPQLEAEAATRELFESHLAECLPYVSYVNAISNSNRHEFTKIRLGTKVPVYAGKDAGMQYIDVGTSIDCSASQSEAGTYGLRVVVERSWVDGSSDLSGTAGQLPEPIIRQFKNEMEVTLRDGQTSEPTVATDSMTGKVMKIEVSLSVLKSL